MLVLEAVKEGRIPPEFEGVFPTNCEHCGTAIEIDPALTSIGCPNAKCPKRKAERAHKLLESLGITGDGPVSLLKIFKSNPEISVLEVLLHLNVPREVYERQVTLKEFISLFQIPKMTVHGLKIFDQWSTFSEMIEDMEKESSPYMVFLKFFKKSESADIYFKAFVEYAHEFESAVNAGVFINRRRPPMRTMYIAITGTPRGYTDKPPYIADLVDITEGLIEFKQSVDRNKLSYVVADTKERTAKYKLGEELGILITSQGLKMELREAMIKYGKGST